MNPPMKQTQLAKSASRPLEPNTINGLKLHFSDGTMVWQDVYNGPTAEQMDDSTDEQGGQDYFKPIPRYSKKELLWCQKLAIMLVEAQEPTLLSGGEPFFVSLPAGYRLYEHIKVSGGKTRSDTYLYGHPNGPRKRFRSSMDFYPHLVWMATDVNKDSKNCPCRGCGGKAKVTAPAPKKAKQTAEPEGKPSTNTSESAQSKIIAKKPIAQVRRSTSKTMSPKTTNTATTTPIPINTSTIPANTIPDNTMPAYKMSSNITAPSLADAPTLPPPELLDSSPTAEERKTDILAEGWFYRVGEIVWVSYGETWALGVVTSRLGEGSGYTIQCLVSPLVRGDPPPTYPMGPQELRPWHTWSVPLPTEPGLKECKFDTVDWPRFANSQTLDTDASILKATAIDRMFSLLDKLPFIGNGHCSFYAGVYFGAEKIWVGDIVVLLKEAAPALNLAGSEIMVISAIHEGTKGIPVGAQTNTTDVFLTGEIYAMQEVPVAQAHEHQILDSLPKRLVKNTDHRNQITSNPNKSGYPNVAIWKQVGRNVTVSLDNVRGRWYMSQFLLPGLRSQKWYNQMLDQGKFPELATYMNRTGQTGQPHEPGWLKVGQREHALIGSVQRDLVIDPYPHRPIENAMQDLGIQHHTAGAFVQQQPQQQQQQHHQNEDQNEPQQQQQNQEQRPQQQTMIDLTGDDEEENVATSATSTSDPSVAAANTPMDDGGADDSFMRNIDEDVAGFFNDDGDGFYSGL